MGKNYSKPHGLLSERRKRSVSLFSRKSTIAPFILHLDTSMQEASTVSEPALKKPDGPNYIFPVNEKETGLMQARHYLYKEIWGGNFASPITNILQGPARVLDVGCGPGTWICENASEFPHAKFTGVDVVPIFPKDIKPVNSEFILMNILEGFPNIKDHTFDFVHVRNMMYVLTIHDWPEVIKELVRITKPGGYIEISENDLQWYNEGLLTADLRNRAVDYLRRKRSIEPMISKYLPDIMKATHQLPVIHQEERTVPIGSWGGNIGKTNFEVYKWGAENLAEGFAPEICLDGPEYLDVLSEGFKELDAGQVYQKHFRFWAKKRRLEDLIFTEF